jgi:hypothetical protein
MYLYILSSPFLLVIVLYVHWFTDSDNYSFDIIKIVLVLVVCVWKKCVSIFANIRHWLILWDDKIYKYINIRIAEWALNNNHSLPRSTRNKLPATSALSENNNLTAKKTKRFNLIQNNPSKIVWSPLCCYTFICPFTIWERSYNPTAR